MSYTLSSNGNQSVSSVRYDTNTTPTHVITFI